MQTINRLPPEILLKVFSYLTFSEKLNVAITCKKWETLVLNGNLFEDFKVEGEQSFQYLTKYFEHNKLHRSQVRRLGIVSPSYQAIEAIEIIPIPEQFPNLEELFWDNAGNYEDLSENENEDEDEDEDDNNESEDHELHQYDTAINEENIECWKKTTKFTELDRFPISFAILKNGGFCNLVELDIDLLENLQQPLRPKYTLLIKHLTKAPKLKRLALRHSVMSLVDFDQLHCNTEQLEALCLDQMIIKETANDEQNRSGLPIVNGLIELCIYGYSKEEDEILLTNVAGKYPDLKILKIHSQTNEPVYGENLLIKIISDSPHLETYDVDIHPLTPKIMHAMDTNNLKLKAITIKLQYEEDLLMQIKNLIASNQKNSVETMKIVFSRFDYDNRIEIVEYFDFLKMFPRLKHLELNGVRDTYRHIPKFPIAVFLKKFQNLETLVLKNWIIHVASVDSLLKLVSGPRNNFKTTLRSLILDSLDYEKWEKEEFLSFISKVCPKVSQLRITEPSDNYDGENYDLPISHSR
ncbi:hypothetical protein [Parasitella parasitica]|uniref:F-box domain-containing protein n=1 Tax=Parasitella parasitica TaxID=35722 RepID=A0A0B7NCX1_9FUNG|nr:hypothetical protein [Parasitella parasitica]